MSLVRRMGIKGPVIGTLLSMVEVVFFFGVLTVAYFVGMSSLYVGIRNTRELSAATEEAEKLAEDAKVLFGKVEAFAKRAAATTKPTAVRPAAKKLNRMAENAVELVEEAEKLAQDINANRMGAPTTSPQLLEATKKAEELARQAEELAQTSLEIFQPSEAEEEKKPAERAPEFEDLALGNFFIGSFPFFKLSLLTEAPVWMWFVEMAGYLLLVTIYWVPGDEATNKNEMRALVLTMVLACVVAGIYFRETVGHLARTFWNIVAG